MVGQRTFPRQRARRGHCLQEALGPAGRHGGREIVLAPEPQSGEHLGLAPVSEVRSEHQQARGARPRDVRPLRILDDEVL
eukprot:2081268-Pyramimonas_sp.AAC.1